MRKYLALGALAVVSSAGVVFGVAGPAAANTGTCSTWTVTPGTLTVKNTCGPYHTYHYFTPHVHAGGSPTVLSCKAILASASATWSLGSRIHVDSVSSSTTPC